MPPRLRARYIIELNQLRSLLPWAKEARYNSYSAMITQAAATKNNHKLGEGSTKRDLKTCRSSLLKDTSRALNARQSSNTTIVHRLLSTPNPPLPSAILIHLLNHPSHLTRSSGNLLIAYAKRFNDVKTQKSSLQLMIDRNIVPLGHRGRLKSMRNEKGLKRNDERIKWWAGKMWSPIPALEDPQRYTTDQLLGRLHHLLINKEAPCFEKAWTLLGNATDFRPTLYGKGKEKERNSLSYSGLALLNLYMSYLDMLPQFSPLDLLNTYQSLTTFPPNRQTLHLSVLSVLPYEIKMEVEQVTANVLSIISRFANLNITPDLETWRYMGRFAVFHDIRDLGKLAFEGWFAILPQTPSAPVSSFTFEGLEYKAVGEPRMVFYHTGTRKKRWGRVLERMKEKGWVTEVDKTRESWGYVWKNDAGQEEDLSQCARKEDRIIREDEFEDRKEGERTETKQGNWRALAQQRHHVMPQLATFLLHPQRTSHLPSHLPH
ncbi:hypothetical protein L204_105453 [Cryptococcus depauperatus]